MSHVVRYTYRLRPGVNAERALEAEWGRCRWLWNEMVGQRSEGKNVSRRRLAALLTEARRNTSWLRAGWQNAQEGMITAFVDAVKRSSTIRGYGPPRAKKKHRCHPSLGFTRNGFAIVDGRLRLPKGTVIPVVWSRELPSEPSSVRVFRDTLGHWYASFVVQIDDEPLPSVDGHIGIDWGVSKTATTTDERFDVPHLGHRRRCAAELAKAQRSMARRHRLRGPQSIGYKRAKQAAAKVAKRAQRQNTHDARVWAQRVVAAHDLIAVEDFRPKFLAKSTMARKTADAAVSSMKRELIERGQRAGRRVVLVPPAYTTRTCSACFARATQPIGLGQRVFLCEFCGHFEDRDRNAARVILATAERGRASADEVTRLDVIPSGIVGTLSELESLKVKHR